MLETARDPIILTAIFLATSGLTVIHLVVVFFATSAKRWRAKARRWHRVTRNPTVTFVVSVYNDELTIGPCIESILAQTRKADAIVVVDDGSTDETPAVVRRFASRGVRVLTLKENVGKTRALEFALATMDTDLVAITDADSIVHHNYLREVLLTFRDSTLSGVGGAVESIPHSWVTSARQVEYLLTLKVDRAAEDAMGALIVLPGVSSTYRRKDLLELGFEHDTIAEDFDLTFRMHKAGKKLAMNPRAIVYTSDPPTLRSYHDQLTRWYTDLWITVRKHKGMLGRKVFGAVEVPLLVANMIGYSAFVVAVPIYLAIFDPPRLLVFFAWELAMDAVLTTVAAIVYRRADVLWAIFSRAPTRFIARFVTLLTFVRVAIGRPGRAWVKLERRGTHPFFANIQREAREKRA